MPAIYMLDVPEFRPVIDAFTAQGLEGERSGGYVRFSSPRPIELKRTEVKMESATWFGFTVGGIDGRIARLDEEVFRLE